MTSTLKLALLLGLASGLMSVAVQAADWTAREAELVGLHQLCDKGDRKACVRFAMLLGEAKERGGGSIDSTAQAGPGLRRALPKHLY